MEENVFHDCKEMPCEVEIELVDDGPEKYWRMQIGDFSNAHIQQAAYLFGIAHCPYCGERLGDGE